MPCNAQPDPLPHPIPSFPHLLFGILVGVSLRSSGYVTCQGWPPAALMAVMMTAVQFLGSMVGFFSPLPPLRVLMALSGSFADAVRILSGCAVPVTSPYTQSRQI